MYSGRKRTTLSLIVKHPGSPEPENPVNARIIGRGEITFLL